MTSSHRRPLTRSQWCRILSGVATAHFVIGLILWAVLIYSTMRPIARNYPADVAATEIQKWAVVFSNRVWKCILPLGVAIISFHQSPRRPRLSAACLVAICLFTAIMSYSDISANRWDLHTFEVEELRSCEHYCTWWWYHDCFVVD